MLESPDLTTRPHSPDWQQPLSRAPASKTQSPGLGRFVISRSAPSRLQIQSSQLTRHTAQTALHFAPHSIQKIGSVTWKMRTCTVQGVKGLKRTLLTCYVLSWTVLFETKLLSSSPRKIYIYEYYPVSASWSDDQKIILNPVLISNSIIFRGLYDAWF